MKRFARALPILLLLAFFGIVENAHWACAAQPPPYDRQANFTDWSTAHPDLPHSGTDMDNEFNAVKTTLDAILGNLVLIQRDDGKLANGSVGADQLDPSITIGVNPVGDWTTATDYGVNDAVWENNILYRCVVAHISGVFATDLAAGDWEIQLDLNQFVAAAAASAANASASQTAAASSASGAASASAAAVSAQTAAAGSATSAFNSAASATASAASAQSNFTAIIAQWKGPWITATAYGVGDKVSDAGSSYISILAHTSGATTEPGVGASWTTNWNLMAQKGSAGAGAGDMISTNNLSDVANKATGRANMGLAIGTNVEAWDADLDALGGVTSATDTVPYFTASHAAAVASYTSAARTFDAATNAAGEQSAMGVTIGTNVEAWDADLDALAGVTSAADKLPYFTASHAAAVASYTSAARTFDAATNAAGEQSAMGLGTAATANTGTSAGNVVVLDGSDKLPAVDGSQLTNVSAGGSFTFIASHTASSSSTLDFPTLPSTCAAYKFILVGVRTATTGANIAVRTSSNGGSTYDSGGGAYVFHQADIEGSLSGQSVENYIDTSGSSFKASLGLVSASGDGASGEVDLYGPANTTDNKYITAKIIDNNGGSGAEIASFYGYRAAVAAVTGVRFLMSGGNIASGTIYGYCLKTS